MIRTDVLVLGAGLAGLSTAHHLRKLGFRGSLLVAEKEGHAGGRAATVFRDGFFFDHTGHLLHLHDPYAKRLVLDLLRGNIALHERSSWIHSHGILTRYPFQANTFGLPPDVTAECVAGFMRNVHRPAAAGRDASFLEWCLSTFGRGITRHFLEPYNRKLWRMPLRSLTTEWQGRFLPRPAPEEVLYGALMDQKKFFGYNAFFRYPLRGGAQSLPNALAARVDGLQLGCRVLNVDLRERTAVIEGLGEVRYRRLVNTMPLHEFLDLSCPLPAPVRRARRRLSYRSVYNLNIGIQRPRISGKHWIYFPEDRFVFYRAGFCSNFSRHLAPRGTTSMYIEVSRRPGERADLARLERQCLQGLRSAGILRPSDRLAARVWIPIECAYVVFDRHRTPSVRTIMSHLASRGVRSIGRWGAWKYSFMEETLLDGKRCAERLMGRGTRPEKEDHSPLTALR